MAVADSTGMSGPYFPNGSTVTFPFDFFAMSAEEVAVAIDGSVLSPGAYSVAFTFPVPSSGSVTLNSAPGGGTLLVYSDPEFSSGADFAQTGAYLPDAVDAEYDHAAVRDQALKRDLRQTLRAPLGEIVPLLPNRTDRAAKYLGFNAQGDPVAIAATGGLAPGPIPDRALDAAAYGLVATSSPDHSTDHQPLIQQLIALAESLGIRAIRFPDGYLSIRTPLRTYHNDDFSADQSGIPFVITKPMTFVAGPSGTTLLRRKHDGSDPAVFAGTQMLAGNAAGNAKQGNGQQMPWRGGMFFLAGIPTSSARPAYTDLPSLTLRGTWDIDGGIPISSTAANTALYGTGDLFMSNQPGQSGANPPYYELKGDGSGDGWDICDKGVFAGFDTHVGDLTFDGDIRIGGFRGELIYNGGQGCGSLYQYGKLTLHDTDGDAFNPGPSYAEHGPPTVQITNAYVVDCLNVFEGISGENGLIRIHAERCIDGSIQGGQYNTNASISPSYYYPTRVNAAVVPLCEVDLTLRKITRGFSPGSWLRGKVTLIDASLSIGNEFVYPDGPYDIDLVVDIWADQGSVNPGVSLAGHSVAGKKTIRNVRLKINCHRTERAKANGFYVYTPLSYSGSMGENIWIEGGSGLCKALPIQSGYPSGTPDNLPNFRSNSWVQIPNSDTSLDVSGNYWSPEVAYDPAHPEMGMYTTLRYSSQHTTVSFGATARVISAGLPHALISAAGADGKVAAGAQWSIFNAGGAPLTIPPAQDNGGQRLSQALMIPPNVTVDFEFDGAFWVAKADPPPVVSNLFSFTPKTGSAAIAAAGGRSDIYVIPLPGCTTLAHVHVTLNFVLPDYAQIVSVAAVDQVKFWIINNHPTTAIAVPPAPSLAQASMTGGWA